MIGKLLVDKGDLYYRASAQNANIQVAFALAAETGALPLTYKVTGSWKGEPLTAAVYFRSAKTPKRPSRSRYLQLPGKLD